MRTKETAILADALYKSLPKTAIDQLCADLAEEIRRGVGVQCSEVEVCGFLDDWIKRHRTRAGMELQR